MKIKFDEKTKLTDIIGIDYELALMLFQSLKLQAGCRSRLAGHWNIDPKTKTFSIEMLTLDQIVMLDILLVARLSAVSDLVEALDHALELSAM